MRVYFVENHGNIIEVDMRLEWMSPVRNLTPSWSLPGTEIEHRKLHKSDLSEEDLLDMPMYNLGQKWVCRHLLRNTGRFQLTGQREAVMNGYVNLPQIIAQVKSVVRAFNFRIEGWIMVSVDPTMVVQLKPSWSQKLSPMIAKHKLDWPDHQYKSHVRPVPSYNSRLRLSKPFVSLWLMGIFGIRK